MRTLAGLVALTLLSSAGICSADHFERAHELGFSLGTPSGLNAEYAREFGDRALYISGAYLGRVYGVQIGASTVRTGTPRKYFSLNVIGGYSSVKKMNGGDPKTWNYVGAEVLFRWRRFFMAPGITGGSGSFSSPQFSMRLGFNWKL